MKIIICTMPNGWMHITSPNPRFLASFASEQEGLAAIMSSDIPAECVNPEIIDNSILPSSGEFRAAWRRTPSGVEIDMIKARVIIARYLALAHAAEIARLKVAEPEERLNGNTAQADQHAADLVALEALDLNVLATQIAAAPNPTALRAIWPANVPR